MTLENNVEAREVREWEHQETLRKQAEIDGVWVAAIECGVPPFLTNKRISRADVDKNEALTDAVDHALSGGGVFLFGGVGVGKTHLASVMVIELLRGYVRADPGWKPYEGDVSGFIPRNDVPEKGFHIKPLRRIVFWSVPELFGRIRDSFDKSSGPTMEDRINHCVKSEVLVLDDLGAHRSSEWTEETLHRIVDGRYRAARQTIYTSNQSLEDLLELVGERVVDRISETCRVVRMSGKSQRGRQRLVSG